MMTHSRPPSSLVAVVLVCCCAALPCRATAPDYPSSQAVANVSLSAETVVAPPVPATTQASEAEPNRAWNSRDQQDVAQTTVRPPSTTATQPKAAGSVEQNPVSSDQVKYSEAGEAVGLPSSGQIQPRVAESVERSLLRGGQTRQHGGELAAARPWYLRPVSALAVVVALILVAAWAAKRWLPGVRRDSKGGPMQVLATTYLSPKQSLALVRCGRRVILIGVTPEHISSLAVMDETNELPDLAHASVRGDGERLSGQFNEALDEAASDFGRNDAAWDEPLGPDERELAAARQEIRGLLNRVRSFAGSRLEADCATR